MKFYKGYGRCLELTRTQKKDLLTEPDKVMLSKRTRGLVFKDIEGFNQVLLVKQAYGRCSTILILGFLDYSLSMYFPYSKFLVASVGPHPFLCLEKFQFGKETVKSIPCWQSSSSQRLFNTPLNEQVFLILHLFNLLLF